MSLAFLFHFLCAQHVSNINISIIKTLWLFCWIIILVVLFLVRCVVEFRCGWVGVISVLQASACNTHTTPTQPHSITQTLVSSHLQVWWYQRLCNAILTSWWLAKLDKLTLLVIWFFTHQVFTYVLILSIKIWV